MYGASDDVIIKTLDEKPELLEEVVDLWWSGQENAQKHVKPASRMITAMEKHLNHDTLPLCLIALKGEQLIGMARLVATWTDDPAVAPKIAAHAPDVAKPGDDVWSPWLCGLIVHEKHRKQGVAHKLIVAIKEKARGLGHNVLYLGTKDTELELMYRRRGFVTFNEDSFRGHTEMLMLCLLNK